MITLYLLRNTVNGKVYIGQTETTVLRRFNGHLYDARNGSKNAVHCALRKYGAQAFDVVTLCTTKYQAQADDMEKWLIAATCSNRGKGYNMTTGGKGDWVCTDELKARLKASITEEERQRRRNRMLGRVLSEQTRSRISAATSVRMKKAYADNPDAVINQFLKKGWDGPRAPLPGEKNGRSKVTESDVLIIRDLCARRKVSQEKIGQQFGITQMMVSKIAAHRAWKHVP